MATVYGIVEDAGGTIYVESEPGAGTNMILYWPTSHQSSREAAPEAKPPTLMIVEDQDDLREPFCQFFSSHSFRVVAAASVSEALDKYDHSDTIDVLITDIVLPDGSGLDLSDRLAQRQPELDVVLMSGYVAELREERKGLSTRVYLPKPVSLSELKTAVDDLTRH